VVFADINLSEAPIRGPPYNPGAGGWPTTRYFNHETGKDGAPYVKKTQLPVCQELGNVDTMTQFIETAGNTKLQLEEKDDDTEADGVPGGGVVQQEL
jgi:hypothetical protein